MELYKYETPVLAELCTVNTDISKHTYMLTTDIKGQLGWEEEEEVTVRPLLVSTGKQTLTVWSVVGVMALSLVELSDVRKCVSQ